MQLQALVLNTDRRMKRRQTCPAVSQQKKRSLPRLVVKSSG